MTNWSRNGGPHGSTSGTHASTEGHVASSERADLLRALGVLSEEPRPEHRRLADLLELPEGPEAGEFTDVFVMNLYPYASVHLGEEGMLGGEARQFASDSRVFLGSHRNPMATRTTDMTQ